MIDDELLELINNNLLNLAVEKEMTPIQIFYWKLRLNYISI
jgi:hypothetical protein